MFTRSPPKPDVASAEQTPPMQRAASALAPMGDLHYAQRGPALPAANRTGLPDRLKSGVEALSGINLDAVRVHYNSPQPARLQAHAYTQGNEIHLAPGQEKHLPHETWHVVQQTQGRVRATLQLKGTHINDDTSLESEADVMGARALHTPAGRGTRTTVATAGMASCIQREAELPRVLTLELIIKFLRKVIAKSGEVSVRDQKRISEFVAKLRFSRNRTLMPIYHELCGQAQFAEGGPIHKKFYGSEKKPEAPSRKRARPEESSVQENEFSGDESELSDNDLDIEALYKTQPSLYQQAVDHSDAKRVKGVINPRNTNMLAFHDRSLVPSSINGMPNTKATRKSKRRLAVKLKNGSGNLRAKQERVLFGSHLRQGGRGTFNSSIETLKRRSQNDELGSAAVKRLVTTRRAGFSIADTDTHAEQSLLRSEAWDAMKARVVKEIKASTSSTDVPKVEERSNAILLTFVLNRSSCRGCGLALSLALIEFWEQLGVALGDKLTWREIKKKYAGRARFVVRFPTIYKYDRENKGDFGNLREVLASLQDAGWEIAPILPDITGGLESYNKLVEILKELKAYPGEADLKYFLAGGAPKKATGSLSPGLGSSPGLRPGLGLTAPVPVLVPLPLPQPPASGHRVAQELLRAYLTSLDAAWAQPFNLAPQVGTGGGTGNVGVLAHQVIAHNPRDVLPQPIGRVEEAEMLARHGLRPHVNTGRGALCLIYSTLMGLTGQSEDEVAPMVNYVAQQVGITEGWFDVGSPLAIRIVAEIERIYATPIDLVVVQLGNASTISARGGNAGGHLVVLRQTAGHYDAYVPR